MGREAANTDFDVKVPGVGAFRFGKRTMRDQLAIEVEFCRIIDGVEPSDWLKLLAGWIAVLRVMTVVAPSGFDLDEIDPLDPKTYEKIREVHSALAEKEADFRGWKKEPKQSSGAGVVEEPPVLVSPEVQPTAE